MLSALDVTLDYRIPVRLSLNTWEGSGSALQAVDDGTREEDPTSDQGGLEASQG
jgi:hypothetical protein